MLFERTAGLTVTHTRSRGWRDVSCSQSLPDLRTNRLDPDWERALIAFGSALDAERRRQSLTVRQWRERAQISKKGTRWLSLRSDPKLSTLARAAAGLGCVVRVSLHRTQPTQNTNAPLVAGRLSNGRNDV